MSCVPANFDRVAVPQGFVYAWYIGQVGFLFKTCDVTLLIDPYLSDSIDRDNAFAEHFTRRYPPPCTPAELLRVNATLCTHNHQDHMDVDTLCTLAQSREMRFVSPSGGTELLGRCGVSTAKITTAREGQPIHLPGCSVHPIRASHHIVGKEAEGVDAVSYILKFSCGITFFHGGDMTMYDGLVKKLQQHAPNIMILPINGRSFDREADNIVGNTDAREAIALTQLAGAEMLIPAHFDLYPANDASPAAFTELVRSHAPTLRSHLFVPGECAVFATHEGTLV